MAPDKAALQATSHNAMRSGKTNRATEFPLPAPGSLRSAQRAARLISAHPPPGHQCLTMLTWVLQVPAEAPTVSPSTGRPNELVKLRSPSGVPEGAEPHRRAA